MRCLNFEENKDENEFVSNTEIVVGIHGKKIRMVWVGRLVIE